MKHRIILRNYFYMPQQKILFFWHNMHDIGFLTEQKALNFIREQQSVDKIVWESS